MVEPSHIPDPHGPFVTPTSYGDLEEAILSPVRNFLSGVPAYPDGAESAHPFQGGETAGTERLRHLIKAGLMHSYKETRNGMLGSTFSTKLSAFLAQGCVTARQVHHELLKYEDGTDPDYEDANGYGNGENDGTSAVRFELLWRDYMRLCTMKFGARLFRIEGFRDRGYEGEGEASAKRPKWKSSVKEDALPDQKPSPEEVAKIIQRFNTGTTGMGLIDASQRELLHTGYTSNRARQNVASFLTKHLGIDWRFGAEWYEMMLVDYDVSSNWANWQYVAGVGNDPRGEARIFNPVKQAFDYDKEGTYVRTWVQEVKPLEKLENVFQVSTTSAEELEKAGLTDSVMVTDPVKQIEFLVDGKPKNNKRPFHRARGWRRQPGAGPFDSNGRPINQSNGPAGPGSSDGSTGPRGTPHRGRGGGYNNGGPRRGFYSGRGRGQYAGPNYGPGYFGGPPVDGQMGSFGRGAYHNMAVSGGFQGGYPAPYPTGPPS
jgi:deoxyribodipyrimidine photo-lyase